MNEKEILDILNSSKSVQDKCKDLGISKSSYYRLLKKYNILQEEKKYCDREWLYSKYIIENLSMKEIAILCSTTKTTINRMLASFNIVKDKSIIETQKKEKNFFKNEEFKEKRKETLLKKYGVLEPHQNIEVRKKYKNTMVKLYGVESPLQKKEIIDKKNKTMFQIHGTTTPLKNSKILERFQNTVAEKYRVNIIENNISDKIHIRTFRGKTLKEIAEEENIGYTTITQFLRNKESITDEEFLIFLEQSKSYHTDIEFIISKLFNIDFYNKKILNYRPDFKLSENIYLNVDGLFWHSEFKTKKDYHFKMRKFFEDNGLTLFQFREDEVKDLNKLNIIKSIVSNKLNKIKFKVGARKCVLRDVDNSLAKKFLNQNHIMGALQAKHIGLYLNDELISIFTYKIFKKYLKVERFCSKTNWIVNGAFSKFLKFIENQYTNHDIHYWVDLRYGTGKYLEKLNFNHQRDTLGWKWTDFKNTYNRLKCRANMDGRGLSEKEHAAELGWAKIYDAGQRLYIKEKK